jgi:hypothetical protein
MNDTLKAEIAAVVADIVYDDATTIRKAADARITKAMADVAKAQGERDAARNLADEIKKVADDALDLAEDARVYGTQVLDAIHRQVERLERAMVKSRQHEYDGNEGETPQGDPLMQQLRAIDKASRR